MELYLRLIIEICVTIPLIVALVNFVKRSVKEKNWSALVELTLKLMQEAETQLEVGADKKEWVVNMIMASADAINYDVTVEEVESLIEDLIALSEQVNKVDTVDVLDEDEEAILASIRKTEV